MSEQTLTPPDETRTPPRRLRRTVSARTLEGRGIAVSAGRTAVVLDGAAAEQLWAALEPVLRTGVVVPDLLDRLPEAARPAASGLLGQLEEHALLCSATTPGDGPLGEHFERTADDPAAASAAAARAVVEVAGDDDGLVAEILAAFAGTGLQVRASRTPAVALRGAPGATVTLLPDEGAPVDEHTTGNQGPTVGPGKIAARGATPNLPSQQEHSHRAPNHTVLVLRAGDWRLVGPAPETRAARDALRTWATRSRALSGPDNAARDAIADRLTGAQAVLDTLTALAGGRPEATTGAAAHYHLTSPDVVSEVHPLQVLPDLAPGGELLGAHALARGAAPRPLSDGGSLKQAGGDGESLEQAGGDGEFLERTERLWLGPLSPWSGPVPGELPQLPVGLAAAATGRHRMVEAGLDTADARAACVERLAELTTTLTAGRTGGTIGAGRDPLRGVARAITHWAHQHLTWRDPDPDRPETLPGSPFARRLWTALTLREGVAASTRTRAATVEGAPDLVLVEVLDDTGRILGSGLATTAEAALDEALVPAVGAALVADAARTTVEPAPRPRLEPTLLALTAWAAAAPIEVRRPAGAHGWELLGLHPRTVTSRAPGSRATS